MKKQPDQARDVNQETRFINRLIQPWYGTSRNVNADCSIQCPLGRRQPRGYFYWYILVET